MHPASTLRIDTAALLAFMAGMRLWLAEAAAWLGMERWLRCELDHAALDLKHVLFLRAFARTKAAGPSNAGRAPYHVHVESSRRNRLRALTGGALKGLNAGSLKARIARMQRMLDNPEPLIERIVRRIVRVAGRLRRFRLVIRTPRRLGAACAAPCAAPRAADTS